MGTLLLTANQHHTAPPVLPEGGRIVDRRVLRRLERPSELFANLTPNWFASIMGTGIVATAAATLPLQFPGLRTGATIVWALASLLLILLTAATGVHWLRHHETAKSHHANPVMAHFYGAPPMALLTVGAGTLLLGKDILGEQLALGIDVVLWTAGTVLGLASAVAVPYLQFTRHEVKLDSAFGGWLMPVVPPMVSASTGALLLPYVPAGQARLTLLMGCYAMFGMSLLASLIIITLIWSRLAGHKIGAAAAVPTLWIVLGPLGQSITAANLLGGNAHLVMSGTLARAMEAFGILYGVPVLGFALMWSALATAITIRTARQGLPFSLTWWSFTFPVGTCVTGLTGLAAHTHLAVFEWMADAGYALLVAAWIIVATRTFHGSILEGTLFQKPTTALPTAIHTEEIPS
ncbi:TDT family transporter [Arthrobacter sp. H14-L1]|uniref:TDT family transporter n=1 Tax=Arthrobacter sp. H14-L1 TaxID=2996697 RepID=UPI002271DE67|nr:TDT family transporter [Arthrobacter sp. H14-L1]MCY0905527.1 TDT family transporter [Arthrobacter sp. H14-L1]